MNRKTRLIEQLAHFLTDNMGGKSVLLQVEATRPATDPRPGLAKEWASLFQAAGLNGYTTFEEAVEKLTDVLTK